MILKVLRRLPEGNVVEEIDCVVLGISLNCAIIRDSHQEYKLVSKYAIMNPDDVGFKIEDY